MKTRFFALFLAFFVLFLTAFFALSVGADGFNTFIRFIQNDLDETGRFIFFEIRLPRMLMAALTGAVLSVSGLIFQTALHNPLAEPYIMGISGGSSLGVLFAVLLDIPSRSGFAFAGAMLVLAIVLSLSRKQERNSLLLSGVMLNTFCGACILFLLSVGQGNHMEQMWFWYLGNLGETPLADALILACIFIPALACIIPCGTMLDFMLLDDHSSASLGFPVKKIRLGLLMLASALTAGSVAFVGPIGFVGLVVPQCLRLIPGIRKSLPLYSVLYGASFLMLCDTLARILPIQGELPVGVITAIVGTPLFIAILLRTKPQ